MIISEFVRNLLLKEAEQLDERASWDEIFLQQMDEGTQRRIQSLNTLRQQAAELRAVANGDVA